MGHRHEGHHHFHAHHDRRAHKRGIGLLYVAVVLTLGFAAVEAIGGLWSDSLALLGDAGHMLSDSLALGLSAVALWFSHRPPSARHSYGLVRAEIVAALVNGLIMLFVIVAIVVHAIERLQSPQPVAGSAVMAVASGGLLVNVVVMLLLSLGEQNLNVRSAMLHVMGDLLGSIAALIAGAVVYFTGWTPIDPLLSLLICALILYSTLRLLREALHVLMEGVPLNVNLDTVGRNMAEVPGALSIHDLHIWTLSSGRLALSAHVVMKDMKHWNRLLAAQRLLLAQRFQIEHVTLQPELEPELQADYESVIPIHPEEH